MSNKWIIVLAFAVVGCGTTETPAQQYPQQGQTAGGQFQGGAQPQPQPYGQQPQPMGAQPQQFPAGSMRADFQHWCGRLGQAYCGNCRRGDMGPCMGEFVEACMANHTPTEPTARTNDEMERCGTEMETANCAMMGSGTLPQSCYGR